MWPLLDVPSPSLFARPHDISRIPQNLKSKFGAEVPGGSALRSIFCSICAQFATSRADCKRGLRTKVRVNTLPIPGRSVRAGPIILVLGSIFVKKQ